MTDNERFCRVLIVFFLFFYPTFLFFFKFKKFFVSKLLRLLCVLEFANWSSVQFMLCERGRGKWQTWSWQTWKWRTKLYEKWARWNWQTSKWLTRKRPLCEKIVGARIKETELWMSTLAGCWDSRDVVCVRSSHWSNRLCNTFHYND